MEAKMANIAQFFHIHLYVYCHGPVATSEFICTTNADKKRKKREIQMKKGQHSDDNNRERERAKCLCVEIRSEFCFLFGLTVRLWPIKYDYRHCVAAPLTQ